MAADIEAESAIFDSSRQPSHAARVSFKKFRSIAVAGKFVASSKTGWPSSYNEDPMMVGIRQIPSLRRFWLHPHQIRSQADRLSLRNDGQRDHIKTSSRN